MNSFLPNVTILFLIIVLRKAYEEKEYDLCH